MTASDEPPVDTSLKTPALKSNSQVIEHVSIDTLKLPRNLIKPPSPAAITVCKRNLGRYGQPGPILVADDLTVIAGLEFLVAAKELG